MKKGNSDPTNGRSLATLKTIAAQDRDMYNRMNQVLDYRKQEVGAALQSLYAQVEDFRLNQHIELKRQIEVSYDLALRSMEFEMRARPWWKKLFGGVNASVHNIGGRAELFLAKIKGRTELAHQEEQAAAERRAADERARAEKAEMDAKAVEELKKREAEMEKNGTINLAEKVQGPAVRPGRHKEVTQNEDGSTSILEYEVKKPGSQREMVTAKGGGAQTGEEATPYQPEPVREGYGETADKQ